MPLYRRPGSAHWWFDVTVNGYRVRRSTQTVSRTTAALIEASFKNQALVAAATGRKPDMTVAAAFGRYWSDHAHRLASAYNIEPASARWVAALGAGTVLTDLTDDAVATYVARRRGAGIGPATCNRDLVLLRAVLRMARDRWGAGVAMPRFAAHMLREPAPRDRYLTPEQADRLIACAAPHLAPAIVLSLATGIRLGNCIRLDWSEVDLKRRELRLRVKSAAPGGKPLVVPLSEPALVALANLPGSHGAAGRVFLYQPRRGPARPLRSWRTAWRAALRRAGIEDFRFHDLRHTAASWMVQAGVPLDVVKDVLGHADIGTTLRYSHRGSDAKRQAVADAAAHWRHSAAPAATQRVEKKR